MGIWQVEKKVNNEESDVNEETEENENMTSINYNIPLQNRYAALADKEQPSCSNAQETQGEERPTPTTKIPPIMYKNPIKNYSAFMTLLKEDCESEVTTKCYNNQIKIQTTTIKDYEKLLKNFKNDGVNYYTYTIKTDILFKVVLKGLPMGVNIQTITEELNKQGLTPIKIVQMNGTTPQFPSYLVYLPPGTALNEIRKIKYIFYTKIYWDMYSPKKKATQCFRCQQYGHAARNCNGPEKCVKCGEDHDSRQCPYGENLVRKCANCEQNHTANDTNCIYYKKYTNKIYNNSMQRHGSTQNTIRKPDFNITNFPALPTVQPRQAWNINKTYASEVNQHADKIDNNINDIFELNKELKRLRALCDIKKMIQALKTLNNKLEKTRDPLERLQIFCEYEESQK